jgi:hypothetical protein
VAFNSQNDWFLLDDSNACLSSNPSHPAYQKAQELRDQGEILQWLTFTPGVYSDCILEHRPTKRIRAVHSLTADNPAGGIKEWAVVPAQFPELSRQRDVKVTIDPPGGPVPDTGLLKQKALLAHVPDRPNGLQVKVTAEVTLYTNRLVPLLAGQAPPKRDLSPEMVKIYTDLPDEARAKDFQDFLDQARLRREPTEADMAFARRVFLYIALHFKYGPNKEGVDTVQSLVGDCGGLAWVFVRALRVGGVPARLLFGRWAASEEPPKDGQPGYGQYHMKGEFFAAGLGWVGIDMSGGVGQQNGGNPLVCFGNEWGDFVVFDIDIPRQVAVFPGDGPWTIWGTQGTWVWPRPDPGKVQWTDHWTVDTLDQHPAATPYRPGWKRPPPSGPSVSPGRPPRPPQHQAGVPAKAADADRPAGAGGAGTGLEWMWPWLLGALGAAVGFGLVLGILLARRGRAVPALAAGGARYVRCVRCGKLLQVPSAAAGLKFRCPACGTVQMIKV